jgi:hypothetical protein
MPGRQPATAPLRVRDCWTKCARIRRLGLSLSTEESYVGWVRRFILANGKRHPREMDAREVEVFLK